MWEKLIGLIDKVFTLSSRTDRLEKDIENLNEEIKRLSILVNEHSSKIDVLVYAV
jgi:predicted ATP-grasp superfamily ATP-dependent carboligase